MLFSDYLDREWVPALGCTEPASIAFAAATAADNLTGSIERISLTVDPKIYKNCYAVGIPHSSHKTGIKWAVAIGSNLPDASLRLECFKQITPDILQSADKIIADNKIDIDVDVSRSGLYIDCTVKKSSGTGRAVIEDDHINIVYLEKNSKKTIDNKRTKTADQVNIREEVSKFSIEQLIELARSISAEDRKKLRLGMSLNQKIAEHGLTLFPKRFVELGADESLTRIAKLVCAGVYARMWGEDFPVMSLAGSGNKGIVTAVPLAMHGKKLGIDQKVIEESLALACLLTSSTTFRLGTLSAVCGCSNAAGIGLAAGLVLMEGGAQKEITLAISNVVGNVTGMICDGAKIGCALKTMTSVDAAFRAQSLAMSGLGIPPSDGIVGNSGIESLINMGRIATRGMTSTDEEILAIMKEKL